MRALRSCALLLLLGSLGWPGWVYSQAPMRADPQRLLAFAHYLREKGDHYRAEGEYRAFLILFPDHPRAAEAWFFLGKTRQEQKEWPEALEAFLQASARKDPRWSGEAALGMAETLLRAGRPEEAAQSLEQLANDPARGSLRSRALWLAAQAWLRARNWERAEAALQELDPEDPEGSKALRLAGRIRVEAAKLPRRDPWVAGGLSALVPGSGHLYAGRPAEALTSLLLNAAFVAGSLWSAKEGCRVSAGILSFLELGWYLGGIESAAEAARRYNREHEDQWIRELGQEPDPGGRSSSPQRPRIWLLGWQWRF